jgi:transposase-like protein
LPSCRIPIKTILQGSTAGELILVLARHGLQQLIALEGDAVIGADRHERTEERHGYRNRYSLRSLTTQVGDINGVTTRIVDALVAALGSQSGMSNTA